MTGLITEYMGSGLFAARPATPAVSAGATALYYAEDTGVAYIWDNGANAWDTVGGGGGGGPEIINYPLMNIASGGSFSSGFFGYRSGIVPKDGTITAVYCYGVSANGSVVLRPGIYGNTATNIPGALLASGPTITGLAQGVNRVPLTSPLTVTKDDIIFMGIQVAGATASFPNLAANTDTGYFASSGVLADPATASTGNLAFASFFAEMG